MWDINSIRECKEKAVLGIGQYRFRCYKLVVLSSDNVNCLWRESAINRLMKKERTSAIGCAYKIPFNPHIEGRMRITGIKQIPCLHAPSKKPSFPFPNARKREEYTV